MTKILIYERGTGVPSEKMWAADVVIEKDSDSCVFYIQKYRTNLLTDRLKTHHLDELGEWLIKFVKGLTSYEIESLPLDVKRNIHCVSFETKHPNPTPAPTRLTSPRVQLENFIYDPSVVWYGPHACQTCGNLIVQSSAESGAIALDAPFEHHYPNHRWVEHECR